MFLFTSSMERNKTLVLDYKNSSITRDDRIISSHKTDSTSNPLNTTSRTLSIVYRLTWLETRNPLKKCND